MITKGIDRRVVRTQRRIQTGLFSLMEKMPYEKIRISQIADKADISRSTFYLHYETKDDLVTSVLDEIIACYVTALDQPDEERKVNPAYLLFSLWKEHIREMRLIVKAGLGYMIYQRLRASNIEHEHLKNLKNDQLNDYVHAMINGAAFALLLQWTLDGGEVPIEQMQFLHDSLDVEKLFERASEGLPNFGKR